MNVLLFDIDGTLLNTGGAGRDALLQASEEVFGIPAPIDNLDLSGRCDYGIILEILGACDIEPSEENIRKLTLGYLELLQENMQKYDGGILSGVVELLQHLVVRPDVALGLLTGNIEAGADLKLHHYGIAHFFEFGAFGDRHSERDDIAREAMEKVKEYVGPDIPKDRIWVIGDTPRDVRCARTVGVQALAVASGWIDRDILAAEEPDLLLDDLSNPDDIINLLQ